MTATTTLKLPENLKSRIASLAKATGKSPHAFMVDAIQTQTELAERRRDYIESAHLAEAEVARTGLVYDADDVFSYVQARLEGETVARPSPVKIKP